MNNKYQIEKAQLGEFKIPLEVYWRANIQITINNFQINY